MRPAPEPKRNVSGLIVWSALLVVLTVSPIRNIQPVGQAPASVQAAVPTPPTPPPEALDPCTASARPVTRVVPATVQHRAVPATGSPAPASAACRPETNF